MLSQTAEYALRAVVWLADNPDTAQTSSCIAESAQVPPRYLYKVLQALAEAGLVDSQPGPRGGYTLARSAEEITILNVVNVVDPIKRINSCPLSLKSHSKTLCPLHAELDKAYAEIESAFAGVNLAQVLNNGSSVIPLRESKKK